MLTVLGFMVGGLLNFIAAGIGEIYHLLGLHSIGTLVYNRGTHTVLGPFAPSAWASILRYTDLFTAAAWILLVAVAIVAGLWISAHGDSRSWQRFSTILWRMLFAGLLLPFNVLIAENLFALNNALVQTLKGMLGTSAMTALSGMPTAGGIHNAFIAGLVHLMLQAETLFFNLLYLERMLVIAALVAIGPLVAWAWVWQQRGTAWGLWFTELTSNILMQAAHALVIAVIWGLLASSTLAWWQYAVAIGFSIPVGSLLRRMLTGFFELIGMREEQAAAGMMGGLMGSARALVGSGGRPSGGGGGPAGSPSPVGGGSGGGGGGGGGGPAPSPARALGGAIGGPGGGLGGSLGFGGGGSPVGGGGSGSGSPSDGGAGGMSPGFGGGQGLPGGGPVGQPGLGGRGSIYESGGQVLSSGGARASAAGPEGGTQPGGGMASGVVDAAGAPASGGGEQAHQIHPLERATDVGGRWGRAIGGTAGKAIGTIAAAPVAVAFGAKAGGSAMEMGARAGRWVGERYGGAVGSAGGALVGAGVGGVRSGLAALGKEGYRDGSWGQGALGAGGAAMHHTFGYRSGEFSRGSVARRLKVDDMPRWRTHGGGFKA